MTQAVCLCILTEAFGHDSAAVLWVYDPVVEFESVHDLQYGAHPADGVVDGHCADELRGQVCVQGQLDLGKRRGMFNHKNKYCTHKQLFRIFEV